MIVCSSCVDPRRNARGFSLVELAIALFIMALLLGSLLVPLQSQVESRKIDETRRILDQAREAVLGYVAANGYFPCPADYASTSGQEAAGSTHTTTGTCPASVVAGGTSGVYIGFLPAVTLGFTPVDDQGFALDAWGFQPNRIRYAVSSQTVGIANPFIRTNGMRTATMSAIQGAGLLSVCNTQTGSSATACSAATTTLTSNAIAVIWSLGGNAGNIATATAQELENAETLAAADRVFVQQAQSIVAGAAFDDQLTWIGPSLLFSRMIAAGTLP